MTSVASYGSATTAGNYTLVFSGGMLGSWVEKFTSTPRRLTEIQERQNFWSTSVILDGSYPAFVYDHEFTLYTENGSLLGFIKDFYGLHSKFTNRARPLRLMLGDTTSPAVDFGDCYLKQFGADEPQDLLLHRAGMLKLQFVGTSVPTVIA